MKPKLPGVVGVWCLCLGLCACPTPQRPTTVGRPPRLPSIAITYHVDVSFTSEQRGWLNEAAALLQQQSAGLVAIALSYDLDFDDTSSLRAHAAEATLISLPTDSDIVTAMEARDCPTSPGCLLGVTTPGADPGWAPSHVYLVTARLLSHKMFVSVAEHELLHAIGLDHVEGGGHLMSASTAPNPITCLTPEDVTELCRVLGCREEDMRPCDGR